MNHFDVAIVGAGLSGIGTAYHLQERCPGKTYVILEARDRIGGTWDLFRYPGIRSDSDMHTLGFSFKPWVEAKSIADGPSILKYVQDTAEENRIRQNIRFGRKVTRADWSSEDATWTVTTQSADGADEERFTCNFLSMCAGYYSYEQPFDAKLPEIDSFGGQVVHPQFWPEALDYSGKRVVVIGSGATAMTLVPSMADTAGHVTMVQRSPTYVASRPWEDKIANTLRKWLPDRWAYAITRLKNVQMQRFIYNRTRTNPEKVREALLGVARKKLGEDYVAEHFTPRYDPWDQRLCLIPDGDLFKSINDGKASVETGNIERITPEGVLMESGELVPADIIVTATGLNLVVLGGAEFSVDGQTVNFPETFTYKGMMYSGVPNMVQTFGYINASWTLRADLTAEYICRLINRMDELDKPVVVPELTEADRNMTARPWIDDFSAGYMQRVMHLFPKQGDHAPWLNTQDFAADKKMVRRAPLEDGRLTFADRQPASEQKAVSAG